MFKIDQSTLRSVGDGCCFKLKTTFLAEH